MALKNLKIIDFIVIILQVGYPLTILSEMIMFPYHIGITAFMIITYLFRFKRKNDPFATILKSRLYVLFFFICLFDILQFLIMDFGLFVSKILLTVNYFLFLQYLNNMFNNISEGNKNRFFAPYMLYGVYNLMTILVAALLISLGVLSATSNPISFSFMDNNISMGASYYFPGFLSVALDNYRVLSDIPILMGLTHEPHVLCFLFLPVAFLLQCFLKKNLWRILIYVVTGMVLVISMSTTAIITFAAVLIVELVWNFGRTRRLSSIVIISLMAMLAVTYFPELLSDTQFFMTNKFDVDTGSLNYSENLLRYVVTPTGFLGTGNIGMGNFFERANSQIGFVTAILDVIFYFALCFKILRLINTKNDVTHYIGMASLYFALHLLKVSFLVFNYPYLIFMMFIIEKFSSSLGKDDSLPLLKYSKNLNKYK